MGPRNPNLLIVSGRAALQIFGIFSDAAAAIHHLLKVQARRSNDRDGREAAVTGREWTACFAAIGGKKETLVDCGIPAVAHNPDGPLTIASGGPMGRDPQVCAPIASSDASQGRVDYSLHIAGKVLCEFST